MVKIRVTCGGCGIEYTDEHGKARHALKTAEDGPFLCDAKQAERLVRLGVAAYVTIKEITQNVADKGEQDPEEAPAAMGTHLVVTARYSAEALEKWDFNDLRKLAADMGVKPEGKKKADYIAAIAAVEFAAGDGETENDGEAEGDDELPELGAADPE